MTHPSWKETLGDRVPAELGAEIDIYETQLELKRQDKIGLTHYFAPPHIVPGVEVAKGPGTSDETYNIIYNNSSCIE